MQFETGNAFFRQPFRTVGLQYFVQTSMDPYIFELPTYFVLYACSAGSIMNLQQSRWQKQGDSFPCRFYQPTNSSHQLLNIQYHSSTVVKLVRCYHSHFATRNTIHECQFIVSVKTQPPVYSVHLLLGMRTAGSWVLCLAVAAQRVQ